MRSEPSVMVIDDNPDARLVLKKLLEAAGYDVACAGDGREALSQLRQEGPPGVILLDLSMPGMDGRQFRQQQLRDPGLADIPVVLVSGEEDLSRAAAALGVDAYLPKPVEGRGLLQTVHALCEGNLVD
jgi:CheY-like chemotaxis protein